jgi:hypothetical protein
MKVLISSFRINQEETEDEDIQTLGLVKPVVDAMVQLRHTAKWFN